MRLAALAVLAVVALAGCGSSDDSGSHAIQRKIDPADQHWVELMLLEENDLPAGWATDRDMPPNPPDDCVGLDFSDLVITGEADAGFENGQTTALQNGIEIYESSDDAHESLTRGDADELGRCFLEISREELAADSEVSIRNLHVDELEPAKVGDESRVFDITWEYVQAGGALTAFHPGQEAQATDRAPFTLRLVAFRHGRALAVVSAGELFGQPPAELVTPLAKSIDEQMTKNPPPKN